MIELRKQHIKDFKNSRCFTLRSNFSAEKILK